MSLKSRKRKVDRIAHSVKAIAGKRGWELVGRKNAQYSASVYLYFGKPADQELRTIRVSDHGLNYKSTPVDASVHDDKKHSLGSIKWDEIFGKIQKGGCRCQNLKYAV